MAEKNLSVKLSLNDKQFQSSLKKSTRSLKKFGASMKRTGQTLSRNLTLPIIAFGAVAVKAFDEQIKAETKLRTALKGNEQAFKNLKEQAQQLQKVTLFGDETTIEAQSFLAQMQLSEQAIIKLIPLIQDFATAQGIGLSDAAKLVAKSVGSSTNALSRYGLVIEGDVGSVERLNSAVDALSIGFKGQAEAVSKVGLGPFQQLSNQLGDVSEQLGSIIVDGIEPLKNMLQSLADALSGTSKETKENIVQYGALAAIIGPIIFILGKLVTAFAVLRSFFFLKLIPIITGVFNAFKLLTPQGRVIGAALAAATFLTANFDKVVGVFDRVKDAIFGVKQESKGLDFSKMNKLPDTSIIGDMRSGKAVNPVTGKPFFTPKPTPQPTATRTRVSTIDQIDPKKIKQISVEFKHLAKNFKLASVEAQDFSNIITSTQEMAANIKGSFMSFGNTIQGVFAQAMQSSDGFFNAFVDGAKQAFKALLAQLAAMIAMKAILGALGFGSLDLAASAGSSALMNILPFQNGGLVTGPTLGLVGEGPGTSMSNPEVIAPLDKLKSMIGESGGGNVEVFGTIKGSDILLSSDRAKNNRNRTRGY